MGTAQGGYGCGIRMALIRYCTPRLLNRCKRCGHCARNFCTYSHYNRPRTELTPYESRSRNWDSAIRTICLSAHGAGSGVRIRNEHPNVAARRRFLLRVFKTRPGVGIAFRDTPATPSAPPDPAHDRQSALRIGSHTPPQAPSTTPPSPPVVILTGALLL